MKGFLILPIALLSFSKPSFVAHNPDSEVNSDTLILKAKKGSFRITKSCDSNAKRFSLVGSIMPIPHLVLNDAEALAIREDMAVIEFVTDSTCSVVGVELAKKGKLKSFTDFATEVSDELYQDLKEQKATNFFACEWVKCSRSSVFTIPLRLKIR